MPTEPASLSKGWSKIVRIISEPIYARGLN